VSFTDLLQTACVGTDPLALLLSGGDVVRYHRDALPRQQTNAEHMWRVVVILHHLWPDASRELLLAALYHDVAEALVGDIPAPVKRLSAVRESVGEIEDAFMRHVGLPLDVDLSPEDHVRLKCADYLELCLTCAEQGGRAAKRILLNGLNYVDSLMKFLSREDSLRVHRILGIIDARAGEIHDRSRH
jgi:5'-deoxynucleotidase YfbR-like HD superfamily hydrolase